MLPPTMLKATVALSFFVGHSIAQDRGWFVPYADSACKKEITDGVNDFSDIRTGNGTWEIKNGYPSATWFGASHFPSAKSAVGGSGKQVWWKLEKAPNTQCHIVMLQQYSQLSYGDVDPAMPSGNIFISAGQSTTGCFFSQLRDGANLGTTYCCGAADCANLSLGNADLRRREENELALREEHPVMARDDSIRVGSAVARAASVVASEEVRRDDIAEVRSVVAAAPKAAALVGRAPFDPSKWKKCKVTKSLGPHKSAGKQTIIGNAQTCTSAPCTFSVTQSLSTSTTLTKSHTETITNGYDASVSVKVGIEWPVEFDATTTAGYSFSSAIADGTDTGMTNSTTTTIANTFGLQVGTTGFATFTPTFLCFDVTLNCGGGDTTGWSQCNPAFGSDGKTPQGDYNVVYTG